MAQYERRQIDSFSTWHTGAGVDINRKTGDIFVIHNGGLFEYKRKKDTYSKPALIAALKTRLNAACVSVNEDTGEVAVVHQDGLNVYQPSGPHFKEQVLDVFHKLSAGARCDFCHTTGDIYSVNDAEGLLVFRKKMGAYDKKVIDNFGSWHSSCGMGVNQSNCDVFVVANHVGGGPGPYPVTEGAPSTDKWKKGDCLARYHPTAHQQFVKSIVDWPVGTLGGADIDVNSADGSVMVLADPGLYVYKPGDDSYTKNTIGAAYSRGEGAAVKFNEETGEILEVAASYLRVISPTGGTVPVDLAMTLSCGVDVTVNPRTGEIIMVDNRGLTIYRKP